MKFSRVYMLCIVAFLAVVFVAEYRMPRRFNWHPSFSAKSTQPFGSQLFDSVLKATLPNGYQVTRQTLYQLEQADTTRRQTVLVVADHLYNLENIDVKTMLRMAERGNKIILVAHGFSSQMEDTMGVYATTDWSSEPMQMGLAQHYKRDSLILWKRYGTPYWSRTFMLYPQLGSRHLLEDFDLDSIEGTSEEKVTTPSKTVKRDYRVLAFSPKSDACMMAVDFPIGKGHVFLASTPLLFTNYGILDDEGRDYVLRILNEVKDLPVVRSTAYLPRLAAALFPHPQAPALGSLSDDAHLPGLPALHRPPPTACRAGGEKSRRPFAGVRRPHRRPLRAAPRLARPHAEEVHLLCRGAAPTTQHRHHRHG